MVEPSSSTSSAYAYKPGGSLKLKGGLENKERKKKGKSKSSTATEHKDVSKLSGQPKTSSKGPSGNTDNDRSPQASPHSTRASDRIMTESERKFEEARRRRLQDKIRREAKTSHKEKVEAFNKYLGSLSEHHDIPKVGPG